MFNKMYYKTCKIICKMFNKMFKIITYRYNKQISNNKAKRIIKIKINI